MPMLRDCMSSADRTTPVPLSHAVETELHSFTIDGHCFAVVADDAPACGAVPPALILASFMAGERRLQIVRRPAAAEAPTPKRLPLGATLTAREQQIVQLVATGHSNKLISKQLQISEWTVGSHLRRIFLKLGVDTRAQMVHVCSLGLVAEP